MPLVIQNFSNNYIVFEQTLLYLQKNIIILGADALDTVSQVLLACFENFEFEKLDSSLNLLRVCFLHSGAPRALVVMDGSFSNLLAKFDASGIPTSSTSDVEKGLIKVQMKFLGLLSQALEYNSSFLLS